MGKIKKQEKYKEERVIEVIDNKRGGRSRMRV
jgi:hypothetical protein